MKGFSFDEIALLSKLRLSSLEVRGTSYVFRRMSRGDRYRYYNAAATLQEGRQIVLQVIVRGRTCSCYCSMVVYIPVAALASCSASGYIQQSLLLVRAP
jgi:hypothetical protein